MSIKNHYSFENTGATWAKLKTGSLRKNGGNGELKFSSDVEGSCFGYAIDWAQRMIQYNGDVEKSRPNKGIGTALQQRLEMKFKNAPGGYAEKCNAAVPFMINNVSLKLVKHFFIDDDKIADKVDSDNLIVIFDIGGPTNGYHWMGMAKTQNTRYFFDSNDGCYSASTQADYRKLVSLFVDDYDGDSGYSSSWDTYSLSAG